MVGRKMAVLLVTCLLLAGASYSFSHAGSEPENPKKGTTLGKHVTAAEAYEMWRSKPEQIEILDVRTPEEYVFVGHAPMAANIPFKVWRELRTEEKKAFDLSENPDFVALVTKYYNPTDTIVIMCRSGDRAAKAVNALAKARW